MTCLPQPGGGCEKAFTDAFATHLNGAEGTHYVHRACLDVPAPQQPEPEALYFDVHLNARLVIERKSICSPSDYFHRHSNDHFVSDLFQEGLKGVSFDALYEIELPMLIRGSQPELRAFVQSAVQTILVSWSRIAEGWVVRWRPGGELWWICRKVSTRKSKGLRFIFSGRENDGGYIDAAQLPATLIADLKKIYSGCRKKFAPYPDARRVLVLDPYEDLRYQSVDWWREVLSLHPPPPEIGEVWSGKFDYITDELKDWIFERFL